MKTSLNKVKRKINIEEYSIKEIFEYFEQFDNYLCIIKTENHSIKFKFHKEAFPHLIGMQYLSKKKTYKGSLGLEQIKNNNISFQKISNSLKNNKNYNNVMLNIKLRLEYLPMFFNLILSNTHIKKVDKSNIIRQTLLKGNYLLFKSTKNKNKTLFPLLSLKQIKKDLYIIETFIVENNISLLGNLPEEKIVNIELIPPKVLLPN